MKSVIVTTVLLLVPVAVAAQSQNQGTGPDSKSGEVKVEESSVLPDAGRAGPSAAPTMARDCKAKPADCHGEPIGATGATDPAPGMPAQSK